MKTKPLKFYFIFLQIIKVEGNVHEVAFFGSNDSGCCDLNFLEPYNEDTRKRYNASRMMRRAAFKKGAESIEAEFKRINGDESLLVLKKEEPSRKVLVEILEARNRTKPKKRLFSEEGDPVLAKQLKMDYKADDALVDCHDVSSQSSKVLVFIQSIEDPVERENDLVKATTHLKEALRLVQADVNNASILLDRIKEIIQHSTNLMLEYSRSIFGQNAKFQL